ncbi:unnamed protein product [Prorocentrum cordatum]|uniref:Uncharacterized protein n=1 Tax=Prorocentrum cordatum TaxID=2364126 RepID=A0ABN9UB57_9DINO|nr:unnamed protein product [Polarella glacialis]
MLGVLATHSRENRAAVAAAGAIPPLVACLRGAGGSKAEGSSHPLCLTPGELPADTAREVPERDQVGSAGGIASAYGSILVPARTFRAAWPADVLVATVSVLGTAGTREIGLGRYFGSL